MTDKILLIGMMGSGKSTVGAALASRLGWQYLDNDSLLLRTAGRTAPEILDADGEPALRAAESRVLTLLLGMPGPVIGGVAGGVVLDPADRARLIECDGLVVWLRATPSVLARRVGSGAGRVSLGSDPAAALRALAAERNGFYEQVADTIIDTDTLPAGAIAKIVVESLVST